MKHTSHSEISAKVASSPTAPQTNPNGDLARYRVGANLTLHAVVEFYVTAQEVAEAREHAEAILDDCAPEIEVSVPTGKTMQVTLHPENIETELLELVEESPADSAVTQCRGIHQTKTVSSEENSDTESEKEEKATEQGARATEEVLSIVGQFLQDDSLEIPNFTDDLVSEALWNVTQAARHARELIKRRALGKSLSPLGYYLRDDQIADQLNIDRRPDGGIDINPI